MMSHFSTCVTPLVNMFTHCIASIEARATHSFLRDRAKSQQRRQVLRRRTRRQALPRTRSRRTAAEGIIKYAIQKSEDGPWVDAITHYRTLATSTVDRCSLALAMPKTGRLHQIRRHLRLAHINHPLTGDVRHGSGVVNRHYRATYNLHRLELHACGIESAYPVSGERVEVFAPLPNDLSEAFSPWVLRTPSSFWRLDRSNATSVRAPRPSSSSCCRVALSCRRPRVP